VSPDRERRRRKRRNPVASSLEQGKAVNDVTHSLKHCPTMTNRGIDHQQRMSFICGFYFC